MKRKRSSVRRPRDLTAFDLYTRATRLMLSLYGDVSRKTLTSDRLVESGGGARSILFPRLLPARPCARCGSILVVATTRPTGLLAEKRLCKRHSGCDRMRAKRILRAARESLSGPLDYDGALAELAIGATALCLTSTRVRADGLHRPKTGQQEEGVRNLERAVELDPRNSAFTLQQLALSIRLLTALSRAGCRIGCAT